jgi:hypothetical protein
MGECYVSNAAVSLVLSIALGGELTDTWEAVFWECI